MDDDEIVGRIREHAAATRARQRPVTLDEVVRRRTRPAGNCRSPRRVAVAGVIIAVPGVAAVVTVVTSEDQTADVATLDAESATAGTSGTAVPTSEAAAVPTGAVAITSDGARVAVLSTAATGPGGPVQNRGVLTVLDASTGNVTASIRLTGGPADIALTGDTAWVSLFYDSVLARVDLGTGTVTARYPLRLPEPVCTSCPAEDATAFLPVNVAAGSTAAWVSTARGYVARVDAETGEVAMVGPLEPDQTGALAVYGDGVLVSQGNEALVWIGLDATVLEIEGSTNTEAMPAGRVITDLHSSPQHPELGVWGTVVVDLGRLGVSEAVVGEFGPFGGVALEPPGCCLTGDFQPNARVVGINDDVWLHVDGRLRRSVAFDDPPPPEYEDQTQLRVPDGALVAISDLSAWWIIPGESILHETPLDGSGARAFPLTP